MRLIARRVLPGIALAIILALGATAFAQGVSVRAAQGPTTAREAEAGTPAPGAEAEPPVGTGITLDSSIFDRIWSTLFAGRRSRRPDQHRPPHVHAGQHGRPRRATSVRVGLHIRLPADLENSHDRATTFPSSPCAWEWRTASNSARSGSARPTRKRSLDSAVRLTQLNGPSDMEIGFKWQLIEGNKDAKWIPTTALITSIFAPTGGDVALLVGNGRSVHQPDLRLETHREADVLRQHRLSGKAAEHFAPRPGRRSDSFERYHQSLVAFYSVTERTTLFYEWYILMPAESANNRRA